MATNLERIQAMMEEIGPAMAEIEAVIQSEDKNWAILVSTAWIKPCLAWVLVMIKETQIYSHFMTT